MLQPDELRVVVVLPLEQLRVPPPHEGVQVGPGWGSDADQVSGGPDLQAHQGDEGAQGLVDLGQGAAVRKTTSCVNGEDCAADSPC